MVIFNSREHTMRSHLREDGAQCHLAVFLPGFFRPVCNHRFAIKCPSHVRLYLQFHVTAIFRRQALIDPASIAIWNRNKVVVTLGITVWGISVASDVLCESLLLAVPGENLESLDESLTNVVLVNSYRTSE